MREKEIPCFLLSLGTRFYRDLYLFSVFLKMNCTDEIEQSLAHCSCLNNMYQSKLKPWDITKVLIDNDIYYSSSFGDFEKMESSRHGSDSR